jgi:nucleoside-diphosphate-sugar epimerase
LSLKHGPTGEGAYRSSTPHLQEIRNERSSRLFLTGATGFLGSHVADRLLREGFQVTALARQSASESASERMNRILDWHATPPEARSRLRVVAGDLTCPCLGLHPSELASLSTETDEFIHCASETDFAERKRRYVEEVNVRGLERLLDLALSSRCLVFHQLSTAFAAGRREGVCPEEISAPESFHNAYEESKWRGDGMVLERCRAAGIRTVIYRPSVVYGHSVTGRSLLFNAVYHPVRAALLLRDTCLKNIREGDGQRARALGVELEPDGVTLRFPLRVLSDGPGLDLVPVDFFVEAFYATFNSALEGGLFHLVSGRPTPVADIARFASRMFGLSGIGTAGLAEFESTSRNAFEAAFEQMIEVYRPYMCDSRVFSTENAAPILARTGLDCPRFTYDVFERCMAYAVASGWGKNLL